MTKEELAEIRERLSKALTNQWCTAEGMVDLVGAVLKDSCRLLDEVERLQDKVEEQEVYSAALTRVVNTLRQERVEELGEELLEKYGNLKLGQEEE